MVAIWLQQIINYDLAVPDGQAATKSLGTQPGGDSLSFVLRLRIVQYTAYYVLFAAYYVTRNLVFYND
jgi:hypothetical protein